MDEQINKYLYDIHEAISSIFSYIGEKRDFNKLAALKTS